MLRLSVVCILMFTILSSTRALHDNDDHHNENHTDTDGTFDVDGVEGLNSFQAILQFVDLENKENEATGQNARNLSEHDVSVLIDIWWRRFNNSVLTNGNSLFKECLNETTIFTILNAEPAEGISEDAFAQVSTILLYHVLNFKFACYENVTPTYQEIVQDLITSNGTKSANYTWNEEDLEEILHSLSQFYIPESYAKCFTAHNVEPSSTHQPQENVESVSSLIVTNLVLGRCIGQPSAIDREAFLKEVFELYGNGHGIISEEGFEKLLTDLGIAEDHHDEENGDHHEDHEDHEDDHDAYDHLERKKREHEDGHHEDEDGHHDDEHEDDHEDNPLTVNQCFTGEELLDIYEIDHEAGINEQTFQEICPALLHQITSGVCQETHDDHGTDPATSELSQGEVWGYGFLSVFLISLCALAGVAVLPCLSSTLYENVIQMLIALAVATLSGDAILHLIPQAVGLHAHDAEPATNGHSDLHGHEEGGDHGDHADHGPLSSELAYVWKCLVAYLAIYLFFLFESMVEMCGGAHTHTHMEHNSLRLQDVQDGKGASNLGGSPISSSTQELAKTDDEVNVHQHNHGCLGVGALPIMVILGDTLHNFGDGMAIGAAFSSGAGSGVSTSIAVLCHELPHELGDFAVLINAGLSYKMALFLNFASALSAFLGLIVGILVSVQTSAREWIFAAAAGMFLYVALVDMMPELIHHHGSKGQSRSLLFILQNIGFLVGAVLILVIALYEDSLIIGL